MLLRLVVGVVAVTTRAGVMVMGAVLRWVFAVPSRRRTDATWFSDGTGWIGSYAMHPYFAGRVPSPRHLRAGWKRMLRRWSVLAVLAVLVWGWGVDALSTAWAVVLLGSVLIGWKGDAAFRWIRGYRHRREVVEPLHVALAGPLGYDPALERPRSRLWVPADYARRQDAHARVVIPVGLYAGPDEEDGGFHSSRSSMRQTVQGIICEKLSLPPSEVRFAWSMTGRTPSLTVQALPPVPKLAPAEEYRDAVVQLSAGQVLLGITRANKPVTANLDSETPHILASMATGAGKSYFARNVAAQILNRGDRVVVLDLKRTSQKWMKDHPHVRYLRDVQDIHDELIYIGEEIMRRQRAADLTDDSYIGPRILVLAEELNTLSGRLRDHWSTIKPKGASGPSPAVTALNEISYMGREPKMNALAIAQYGDARTMGGGAARENYGCRVLGRASRNAWRMLAPEIMRIPRKSTRRGRYHVVVDDFAVETQGLLWTDEAARSFAWGCFAEGLASPVSQLGREDFYQGKDAGTVPAPMLALSGPVGDETMGEARAEGLVGLKSDVDFEQIWASFAESHSEELQDITPAATAVDVRPAEEAITLKQAADMGIVTLSETPAKTLEILRSARKRDKSFPEAVDRIGSAHLFAPDQLQVWARNRERG